MNGYRSASLTIGTVGVSKDNSGIQGLQLHLSAYQVRDNVASFGLHGVISRPLPGAQAAAIAVGGDPSKSVILGTNDPRYYLPGLPDGTVGLGHHLGNTILLRSGTMIELQGLGEVLRKLVTDVFVQLFNEHTHPTPSGTSGAPNQQMTDAHLTGVTRAGGP